MDMSWVVSDLSPDRATNQYECDPEQAERDCCVGHEKPATILASAPWIDLFAQQAPEVTQNDTVASPSRILEATLPDCTDDLRPGEKSQHYGWHDQDQPDSSEIHLIFSFGLLTGEVAGVVYVSGCYGPAAPLYRFPAYAPLRSRQHSHLTRLPSERPPMIDSKPRLRLPLVHHLVQ
jgi:hypothetical protein